MIYASNKELIVGSTVKPGIMSNEYGQLIEPQPVFIIKQCTKKEYFESHNVVNWNPDNKYFYDISTD